MATIIGTIGDDDLLGTIGDDEILGLAGDDMLDGDEGDDVLEGGGGADDLIGGLGFDYASYLNASAGQIADLQYAYLNISAVSAGDTYAGIEGLIGSAFIDSLRGDGNDNWLYGGAAGDSLYGRDGTDMLFGGDGDDYLEGGAGSDELVGGLGFDQALYLAATAGVTVDRLDASANTGDAAGDVFDSIEGLVGSTFDDSLRGSDNGEYLRGEAGSDSLYGRGGIDTLVGGAGADFLTGGEGGDLLIGGDGFDFALYTFATSAVSLSLESGAGTLAESVGDRLFGIEGLAGSAFDDTLFGNGVANFLVGEGGNDFMFGAAGDDILIGGRGDDRVAGGDGRDTYVFGVGDGQDTITDFLGELGRAATPIDTIMLSRSLGVSSFDDVMARAQEVNNSTIIVFDATTSITLNNISTLSLSADNFSFYG